MKKCGLVSISFRQLSPDEIIRYSVEAGLHGIEWGSDVHAPCEEIAKLKNIANTQKAAGLVCSSYGTYFRLGVDAPETILKYIEAAKLLGTDILRLWCGNKGYAEYTESEKEALFEDCRKVAEYAATAGVTLGMECHNNTITDCKEGAIELLGAVPSPSFGMYWQPNQLHSVAENEAYARAIADRTSQIHTFHWKKHEKFPLEEGREEWKHYLSAFPSSHHWLLLEFMPDGNPASLRREAESLLRLAKEN